MRQKLLIVDDEPGIVDMLKSYFEPQYEVLTAYSGAEALRKVAAVPEDPDVYHLSASVSYGPSGGRRQDWGIWSRGG